jgi:hypothetical protein
MKDKKPTTEDMKKSGGPGIKEERPRKQPPAERPQEDGRGGHAPSGGPGIKE